MRKASQLYEHKHQLHDTAAITYGASSETSARRKTEKSLSFHKYALASAMAGLRWTDRKTSEHKPMVTFGFEQSCAIQGLFELFR